MAGNLGRRPPPASCSSAFALLLAGACGGGGGGGGGGTGAGEPAPAGQAPSAPSPLVVMLRYGGVTGANERVSVDRAGQATVLTERSPAPAVRTLSPADLATLRTALERTDIATLQRNYLDMRAADAFQYDVTYQGVTVTADEGVLPATLRPVVDQLTKLLGSA